MGHMNQGFEPVPERAEAAGRAVVNAVLAVHRALGPGLRLGFLINFNVPLVKQGIKRMVL